jgi:hypothetical protein
MSSVIKQPHFECNEFDFFRIDKNLHKSILELSSARREKLIKYASVK